MKENLLAKEYIVENSKYNFIFLHGWGVTYKTLLYFSKMWEGKYSTYLLSLPGFFYNKLNNSYFLDDYLKDIEEFISEKKLDNVVLVGHSFGGKLAIYLKKRNPTFHVVALAPSIINNPFNLLTFLKIKIYKLLKKLNIPLYKLFKGSKDYQNADGHLRQTFLNIVHEYMSKDDIASLNSFLVVGFKNDKDVKISSLKKVKKYNPNIVLKSYKGDHFSYFDHRYEIYVVINELLKEGKI